jgi:starch synthase
VSGDFAVWHVTREYAGIAEAGGVKDVVRGLAEAQGRAGGRPTVVLPLYGFMPAEFRSGAVIASFNLSLPDHDVNNEFFNEPVKVSVLLRQGVRLLLVASPGYDRLRSIYTYTAQDEMENKWKKKGTGHWDFHQLNLVLQRAALETALAIGEIPRVFHCHDGHTAFLPALMREDPRYAAPFRATSALVTVHNAGQGYHQEVWSPEFACLLTGLSLEVLRKGLLNGAIDPLLLAAYYARLVTVSEQYARELLVEKENESAGGLGRALREAGIPLAGITNGIDPAPWDPRSPTATGLPYRFDPLLGDWEGKRQCRRSLAERLGVTGIPRPGPLYAFIGRLTAQKGIDVLCGALERVLRDPVERSFVVLGQGDAASESMLASLARQANSPSLLAFVPLYAPSLATLIYAASDFFLIPSAYEPCGLTDFIAQLLGSIPVVHHVGGLVKVRDGETGFSYADHSPDALGAAIDRTTALFQGQSEHLDRMKREAFAEVFSLHTWDRVLADSYQPLYESLVAGESWTRR